MARKELNRLARLAEVAVQGSLVEVYLRCGTPSCSCHRDPARRHGPHLYLKYRTSDGRSTGLYVPRAHERSVREAVRAWAEAWQALVLVGQHNREALRERLRRRGDAGKRR